MSHWCSWPLLAPGWRTGAIQSRTRPHACALCRRRSVVRPALLRIARFTGRDQTEARDLVLAGLAEHWGEIDPSLNPDLDDIAAAYRDGAFLIGRSGARLVATGALVRRSPDVAELVRMSVVDDLRRSRVGSRMFDYLRREAGVLGVRRIIAETSAEWTGAVALYTSLGFAVTHRSEGQFGLEVWFARDI